MKLSHALVGLLWVSVARATIVDDVLEAIKNAVSCTSCHALLVPLKSLAVLGDGPFEDTIIAICKATKLVDADVCEGVVKTQGPIIAHDLRSINPLGQTATKLCDALLGLCQAPTVNKYTVLFPKPPPINPRRFISSGKTPFQVVHFSDVHIDRQYTTGSEANCTKPICCRNYADQKGPVTVAAAPMGEYKCDTPAGLAQSLLRSISIENRFSIFTGDVIEDESHFLLQVTSANYPMNLQFYRSRSNDSESAPTNDFPRTTTTKNATDMQWVYDTQSAGWAPLVGATAASQVAHYSGSYSIVAPGTNLRIISINTVYWYKVNFWLYDSDAFQADPNGILAFTIQELQAAEDAGQRAWIIAHMPPGRYDAMRDQSNYFDQIVQRYRNTIAGQFYGHSHQDEFMISYSDYTKQTAANAVSVGWIAPSITPSGGNPAFKVYDVDPDTYEIMDAKVYSSDLMSPTHNRSTYGPLLGGIPATQPLGPAFWHNVTELFGTSDAAFQMYQTFRTRGVSPIKCDAKCKAVTICDMQAMRAENGCTVSMPGKYFRRGSEDIDADAPLHVDDCEGVNIGHLLSAVTNGFVRFLPHFQQLRGELQRVERPLEGDYS
ncbi:hypothetical protein K443DRAFT_133333 [Laccaria amethystina LaAM-08-1]|uniref:Sphingomyelin phosphodiesterase n=1 Tax=Laccaria amethystina LaAM-08-1 TaxID=1095629 RepID=A0A0C9XMJ7_9AGAR|nr:hypothetical protein K443DRAFT_133333 [Laccaria amethystina LaAM-08-1]